MLPQNTHLPDALCAIQDINIRTAREIDEVMDVIPEDVPEIHENIKKLFKEKMELLLNSAEPQKILPIVGNAGSGKTHILTDLFNITSNNNGIFIPIDISLLIDFYPFINERIFQLITKEIPSRQPQVARIIQNIVQQNYPDVPENIYKELESFKKSGLLQLINNVIISLSNKFPKEMAKFSDISRALFLLSSKDFSALNIASNILQSLEIDDDEKSEFNFVHNILTPKEIFDGLMWNFSLNNSFTVFAYDQFDALIQYAKPSTKTKEIAVNLQKETNMQEMIVISFLQTLKDIHINSQRTFTVLTLFADSWEKLNNISYFKSKISSIFDKEHILHVLDNTSHSKKLLFKILNDAYKQHGFHPPYDTWPFPQAFFDSVIGLFPRDILKRANEYLMACKRIKIVVPWPGYIVDDNGMVLKIQQQFEELLMTTNLDQFKEQNSEMTFWREALIAFAEMFSKAHDGKINGLDIEAKYNRNPNPKNVTIDVKIVASKNGVTKQTFCIWAILQSHGNGFRPRVEKAVQDSSINIKFDNRKLAIVHFKEPSKAKSTYEKWIDFLQRGGIDMVPDDKELASLYALKTIREKNPPEEWEKWAEVNKPTNHITFLRKELSDFFKV
jgi:hypothetical protein